MFSDYLNSDFPILSLLATGKFRHDDQYEPRDGHIGAID